MRSRSDTINELLFAAPLNQHNGFTTFIYAIDAMVKRGIEDRDLWNQRKRCLRRLYASDICRVV